jgi:3-deoxy-manno-octulosonate cytidylyltransferase (CMP-KDO synthetase)
VLGVIPARLRSERLPRKPLFELAGRPLIEWVWRRVSALGALDAVVVATDAEEVVEVCRSFGADVVLTSADHPSGTDRIAEVIGDPAWTGYDVIANVQGDEPFVRNEHVAAAVDAVRNGRDVGTVATPVGSLEAWLAPSVVKVARRPDGAALYFTRAPIPHRRDAAPEPGELRSDLYLRHIGVYAYHREALLRWTGLPEAPLERHERLEQFRPLSAGKGIGVAVVGAAEGGVDTPEDARRAAARLGLSTEA